MCKKSLNIYCLYIIIFYVIIFLIGSAAALETVGKWDVFEINLTTTNTYTNPFKEVSLQATFTSPTNRKIMVNGFYNGKNLWKIRFVPDEPGTWRATTSSNDPELNNVDIRLESIDKGNHGFLRADPQHPYSFRYEDGGPHFLPISQGQIKNFQLNQTTKIPRINYKKYFDDLMTVGFKTNHLYENMVTSPNWNSNGDYSWPFGGSADAPDFDRYNLDQFRRYDEVIDYAESKGVVISIVLLDKPYEPADNPENIITEAQRQSFYRYTIARLGHHRNLIWLIYWDVPANQTYIREDGNYIKSIDPYRHLLTSQQQRDTGYSYATESWADIITLQTLDELDGNDIKYWRIYNKPVIISEDRYSWYRSPDNPPYFFRRLLWASILSGGTATYGEDDLAVFDALSNPLNGKKDFPHIYNFFTMNNISFWEMDPHDDLVSDGNKALAKLGGSIIVYIPNPGAGGVYNLNGQDHNSIDVDTDIPSVTVNLTSFGTKNVYAIWYNPREGIYHKSEIEKVDGDSLYAFAAPGPKDWVLYISTASPTHIPFLQYLLQRLHMLLNPLKRFIL